MMKPKEMENIEPLVLWLFDKHEIDKKDSVRLIWSLSLLLDLRDIWVGLFWNRKTVVRRSSLYKQGVFVEEEEKVIGAQYQLFFCLVPCIPIRLLFHIYFEG